MARLGRGQPGYRSGHSFLRAPTVVDEAAAPAAPFYGPGVKLVPVEDQRGHSRRAPKSVLHPPATLETVVYPGPRVELAKTNPQADPRRKAQYDLAAPVVVFPGGQMGGVGTSLADARNARSDGRRAPHSKLSDPAVVGAAAGAFVAEPIRVARAEPRRQAPTKAELRSPTVVDPTVVYPGPRESLSEHHRPAPTRPELRPPAVVDPAAISRPVSTHLAPSHRPAPTRPELRAPVVLDPANIYGPLEVNLTEPHRPAATHPELRAPAVVDVTPAVTYRPVAVSLTEPHRPAGVRSHLQAPAVVGPAEGVVYEPVDVRLERARHVRPVGHAELAAPTVLGPAAIYRPVQVALVESRKPRLGRWKLAPPTVVAPPLGTPVETTLDVTLAPSRDPQRRFAKAELRAPTVVGPAAVYRPVDTELAPHPRQARAPHSELRAPAVVDPIVVYDGPRTSLAEPHGPPRLVQANLRAPTVIDPIQVYRAGTPQLAPHSRLGRVSHFELRPPTVVFPFVAPPLVVQLRATGRELGIRRPVHPRLRPPTEVTQPSDVIYIDYYDHPRPRGILGSSPREETYDDPTAPAVSSSPDVDGFDVPKPIGEFD